MHPLVKGTEICSNEGPHPYPRGDNYEVAKIHWRKLKKNLLLKNNWTNFNQTWHKDPCEKGIQVCLNKGPRPFSRGDNYEITKIHWQNLKIFFSITTGSISTTPITVHPWVKGFQVCSKEPFNSHKVNNEFFFSLSKL